MLFDRYQYHTSDVQNRGYSRHVTAMDIDGSLVWVKWILGIAKGDSLGRMLTDRLRHLKKGRARHTPEILEYGFDEELGAYSIVYSYLKEAKTLSEAAQELSPRDFYLGLKDVVETLESMQMNHQIAHGDIHPDNILVDAMGKFWIVDFGLADLTRNLSQESGLVVFSAAFAAPEKLQKSKKIGFPHQSDIYSLGKLLDWLWETKGITVTEEHQKTHEKMVAFEPGARLPYTEVRTFIRTLFNAEEPIYAIVEIQGSNAKEIHSAMNSGETYFDISPRDGSNVLLNFVIANWLSVNAIWLLDQNKLLVREVKLIDEDAQFAERIQKYGRKLPFPVTWILSDGNYKLEDRLSRVFLQWKKEKQQRNSQRAQREIIENDLAFYKDLLNKEIEVIQKNALKIEFTDFRKENGSAVFKLKLEDSSQVQISFLYWHIEKWNDFDSDGVEYEIGATGDRRQSKDKITFSGYPFEFKLEQQELWIRDCERLDSEKMPLRGFLMESTSRQEEEKRRQLEGIKIAEQGESQNPNLIHALFAPDGLRSPFVDFYEALPQVHQRDINGNELIYSPNQLRAINLALNQSPISVIQGPPGTGKTTVITEIVFQILATKPDAKILITSQTNPAVDQVLENLLENNIPIMRLNGIREPEQERIKANTVERKLDGWKKEVMQRARKNGKMILAKKVVALKEMNIEAGIVVEFLAKFTDWKYARQNLENLCKGYEGLHDALPLPKDKDAAIKKIEDVTAENLTDILALIELQKDWLAAVSSLDERSPLQLRLVDSVRVIGSTCNHIAAKKYRKHSFEFDYIIMDESGKASVAETLVPAVMGDRLILVGDHRQLRPTLTQTKEVEKWLRGKFKEEATDLEDWDDYFNRPSLFEKVIETVAPDFKAQLTECRRSSALQVKLTSKCFYEAEGDEAIVPVERPTEKEHCLDLAIDSSVIMIDIGQGYGHQKDRDSGSSYNTFSAELIPQILKQLDKFPIVKDYDFGIVTGYTAQKRRIEAEVRKAFGKEKPQHLPIQSGRKFSIAVIDRFQGLERDIMIVDLVKAGPNLELGFLAVPNRINVGLSRQKRLLMIVGDYHGLINAPNRKGQDKKAALQHYLELIPKNCVIPIVQLKQLFQ